MTLATASAPAGSAIRGILLMCVTMLFFSGLDAAAKFASQELPYLQVVWARYFTHFLIAAAILNPWSTPEGWQTSQPGAQILRGLFLFGATAFNFLAITYLQLAETAAIFNIGPLLVALFAIPLLGEKIGIRRWSAILAGFVGVLIVTRPGLGGLSWASLLSVGAATCYAFYAITTRKLAATQSPSSLLLISAAVGAVVLLPVLPFVWQWPQSWLTWMVFLIMGVLGAAGHYLFILAHRLAPAPVLAPFIYSAIIWMVLLGYVIFGDIPTIWTIIGSCVVIGAGLYVLYREQQLEADAR